MGFRYYKRFHKDVYEGDISFLRVIWILSAYVPKVLYLAENEGFMCLRCAGEVPS